MSGRFWGRGCGSLGFGVRGVFTRPVLQRRSFWSVFAGKSADGGVLLSGSNSIFKVIFRFAKKTGEICRKPPFLLFICRFATSRRGDKLSFAFLEGAENCRYFSRNLPC